MNKFKFALKLWLVIGVLTVIWPQATKANPILNIFDELMSDSFLQKMVSYFIDDDDVKSASRASTKSAAVCKLPYRQGMCKAMIPHFRYDPVKKDCFEFYYGGCGGNGNKFQSYKDCMTVCKGV